ncbi:MAG: ABC transporter substrate-binding protein [Promethearchaeota archaeon]
MAIQSEYKGKSADDCPGAPSDITADQIIKVGIIGDTERIQGEGSVNGANLAALEINSAGGIDVQGKTYYIGITSENSDEANPVIDTSVAIAAARKLIDYKKVQFAAGGFRTEAGLAYQDLWMEEEIVFWNTGAATTSLTQKVIDDYDTYKYYFQPSPQNSTGLAIQLITLIIIQAASLTIGTGHNVTRFSFIREDYAWTAGFAQLMIGALTNNANFNMTFAGGNIAVAPDASPTQMDAHWNKIQGNNTQIVIPLFSGPIGLTAMTSYASVQPNCIPIGINVVAQDGDFWTDSNGDAEYIVTLESVFETNKTSLTLPFWNNYLGNFSGTTPIYTATGTYDAVHQLAWAIDTLNSMDADAIVAQLESAIPDNPIEGAGGLVAYDKSHCAILGWPLSTSLAIQWFNGSKILIPAPGLYPSGVYLPALQNLTPIALPSWGLYFYD